MRLLLVFALRALTFTLTFALSPQPIKIEMNKPLRQEGYTLFQQSYNERWTPDRPRSEMYSVFFFRISRAAWSERIGVHSSENERWIPVDNEST